MRRLYMAYISCKQHLEIFSGTMSDACETEIYSFTGITHISEEISRCCLQLRELNNSLHIVHQVTYCNNKAKKVQKKKKKKNDH